MINVISLLNAVELQIELQELRELGLTEEEIDGFIEFFFESWIEAKPIASAN